MPYSVALCTYNGEKFLAEQLQSILAQRVLPKQIVICDDCSTDNTNRIVSDFVYNFPNIDWKHKINQSRLGTIKNFEQAINFCNEEIVFLSDQDDIWLESKTEKILKLFNQSQFTCVFTDAKIVYENLADTKITMFELLNFNLIDQNMFHKKYWSMYLLLSKYHATGATMAFKKSLVTKFMPFPENTCYIHDSWIATLAACKGELTFINEPLILYRQHENQQIGAKLKLKTSIENTANYNFINSFIAKKERENSVLEFFEKNHEIINKESLALMQRRRKIYCDLIINSNSFLKRLIIVLSLKPYILKLQEFMGVKMFVVNSFKYLFYSKSK